MDDTSLAPTDLAKHGQSSPRLKASRDLAAGFECRFLTRNWAQVTTVQWLWIRGSVLDEEQDLYYKHCSVVLYRANAGLTADPIELRPLFDFDIKLQCGTEGRRAA